MSRVTDLIGNRRLFSVDEGRTVADVARRMAEWNVGAILVMRDGRLRGVFSERDLMLRVVLAGRSPQTTPVEQVMSTAVVTVHDSATPDEAMERMEAHGCRHLPVLRGAEVVGLLSMRDLMRYELARKAGEPERMPAYMHGSA